MENERRKEITVGWKGGKRHTITIALKQTDKGPTFSAQGAIWERSGRDCETCGQCVDTVVAELAELGKDAPLLRRGLAEGITYEWLQKVEAYWKRWHLNGMRPGCEHQRDWPTDKQLTIVTYKLKMTIVRRQNEIEDAAKKQLKGGGKAALTETERLIFSLPYEIKLPAETPLSAEQAEMYEERPSFSGQATRETKGAGWVYPKEHPEGLMCKPCPTCGYKYGSAWLYEPLPQEVIDFAEAALRLPGTD